MASVTNIWQPNGYSFFIFWSSETTTGGILLCLFSLSNNSVITDTCGWKLEKNILLPIEISVSVPIEMECTKSHKLFYLKLYRKP